MQSTVYITHYCQMSSHKQEYIENMLVDTLEKAVNQTDVNIAMM